MKFIIIACFISFSAASVIERKAFGVQDVNFRREDPGLSQVVEDLINGVIDQLKPYDPVDVPEEVFSSSGYQAVFKDIHVDGFSGIVVDASVNIGLVLEAQVSLTMAKLSASINSWESNFPILYGNGNVGVDITELNLVATIKYDIFNGGLQPSKLVSTLKTGNANVTGLHNDPELSKKLTDVVNYFLNTVVNSEEFHNILGNLLDTLLNTLIST